MHTTSHLASCQSGLSLLVKTWALPAILALAALAIPTAHADVIFTRSTTTGEHWALRTTTFTPAYSGNYTLGFNVTAGGPSGDNSIIIDAVKVTNGATTSPSISLKVTPLDACRHRLIRA